MVSEGSKEKVVIHIAKDFSSTPGFRYKIDGPYSGEEFRKELLEPHFLDRNSDCLIEVNFDGVAGFATSFLEEAFGGLVRTFGQEICKERLRFVSEEDPLLIDEVRHYIDEA